MPGVGLAIGVFLLILVLSKRERMLRYAYYVLLSLLIAVVILTAWHDPEHAPEAIGRATAVLIVIPAIFVGVGYLIRKVFEKSKAKS